MFGIWESEGTALRPSKSQTKAGKRVRASKPAKPRSKAGLTTHPPLFLDQNKVVHEDGKG